MEGIAQEVGVDMNELKVILVGDETQLDVKPLQTLKEQYHQVEWDLQEARSPQNLRLRYAQDAQLLQSYNTSQTSASLKGSERWRSGDRPVDLYQVGSLALSQRIAFQTNCAMEGVFTSKGAVKMGQWPSFQGGNHMH